MTVYRIVDPTGLPVQADLGSADPDVLEWAAHLGAGYHLEQRLGHEPDGRWVSTATPSGP